MRKIVEFTHDDPVILEIPDGATALIFVGEAVMVRQSGAGVVSATPAAGSGVTLAGDFKTEHEGDILLLYQGATNAWRGSLISRSRQHYLAHTFTEAGHLDVAPDFAWGNHPLKIDLLADEYGAAYGAEVMLHDAVNNDGRKPSKGDMVFVTVAMPADDSYSVTFNTGNSAAQAAIPGAVVRSIRDIVGEWFLVFAYNGTTWELFQKQPIPGTFHQLVWLPAGAFKPKTGSSSSKVQIDIGGNEFDAIRFPVGDNANQAWANTMIPPGFRPADRIKFAHLWTAKDATAGTAMLSLWLNALAPGMSLLAQGPPATAIAGTQSWLYSPWTWHGHIMRVEGEWLWNATWRTLNDERMLQVYVGSPTADGNHTLDNNCDWIGLELYLPVDPITAY
ncbi:MAG: hypothetical protein ACPGVU_25025 [Limisphaerales bacterium]